MDGTIVDSHKTLLNVYQNFMKRLGKIGTEGEFYELVGPSVSEVMSVLRERHNLDLSVEELVGEYHSTLEGIYTNELKLFEGVTTFLEQAKSRNLKIALVTSATEHLASSFLKSKDIIQYFDRIVTPEGGRGKPAPDIYLKALREVVCLHDEAIAIEDSPNGVKAAVDAQIFTIHIFYYSLPKALAMNPLVVDAADWKGVMDMCGYSDERV